MNFVDALSTFISYWTRSKHGQGETVTFEELMGGLIGCLAAAVEQCDSDQQERITQAIHEAFDERLRDPEGKAKEALN